MAIIYSLGTTDTEANRLRTLFGNGICEDYIRFIKNKNGMFLDGGSYCTIPFSKVDDKAIGFQELYGLKATNKNMDIEIANRNFSDEIQQIEKPIIIGGDSGGNFFVLSSSKNDSKVYYWDRAHIHFDCAYDFEEVDEEGNLYILANSYSEFTSLIDANIEGDKSSKTKLL